MIKWILALVLVAAAPRVAHAICVIDGNTGMAFGSYDVYAASPLESSGTITVRCLVSLSVTVEISKGSSTTYANRTMGHTSGDKLNYNLYRNAGRTQIWGDGTGGTVKYGPVLVLISTIQIPVYGSVPARQNVTAGSYSDTVVVTLNF